MTLSLLLTATLTNASQLDRQRGLFKEAYVKARAGEAAVLKNYQAGLADYPLWPDLVSASYLGRLSRTSIGDIEAHLMRHPDISLNRSLRYRHAVGLAKRGVWDRFLVHYEHYRDSGDKTLACYARHAELSLSDSRKTRAAALELWMIGKSQPKACDDLFAVLKARGVLTSRHYTERLHLALPKGQLKLARFLAKSAPKSESVWLDRWESMRAKPERELRAIGRIRASDLRSEFYAYGIKRLARKDAEHAHRVLQSTSAKANLDGARRDALAGYVALAGARQGVAQAVHWIDNLHARSAKQEEWRVRAALTSGDFAAALTALDALGETRRDDDTWRYWRARSLEALGRSAEAQGIYAEVADSRSYYGFLAADRLERAYQFAHVSIDADPAVAANLATDPGIVRARELFSVNLHGPARSEWEHALAERDAATRRQAALLADSWGWHWAGIKTLANSAGQNDLIRSFPTPYKKHFDETTQKAEIARTWAYGITRSESLFMPDVKSSAGAIGLMQLIPVTGKETARRARLPYRGTSTLLDPMSNIRLGVYYLGQMYSRFDDNQVLATAAYNAGPRRVQSWLPTDVDRPADVWVETIPFDETRRYVKRVLYADAVFHWRLTGTERRLAALMPPIQADRPGPVASN